MGDFSDFLAAQRGYRRQFVKAAGPGPWPCCFCGEPVTYEPTEMRKLRSETFVVHHLDGDHDNDADGNHAAAHHGCHVSHHARNGVARTAGLASAAAKSPAERVALASRASLAAAQSGPAHRRARTTRQRDPGHFSRIAGLMNGQRWRCDECGKEAAPGPLGTHQKYSGHGGRTRLA